MILELIRAKRPTRGEDQAPLFVGQQVTGDDVVDGKVGDHIRTWRHGSCDADSSRGDGDGVTQVAVGDKRTQSTNSRVEPLDVSHHNKDAACSPGDAEKVFGLFGRDRDRLFDEHVFLAVEQSLRHLVVVRRRERVHDGVDIAFE